MNSTYQLFVILAVILLFQSQGQNAQDSTVDFQIKILPEGSSLNFKLAKNQVLTCMASAAANNQKPSLYWQINGARITEKSPSARIRVLERGNGDLMLRVDNVRDGDQGSYNCFAILGTQTDSRGITVKVIQDLKVLSDSEQFGIFGQDGRVECETQSLPPAVIIWKNADYSRIENSEKYIIQQNSLLIKNLDNDDAKHYICDIVVLDTGDEAILDINFAVVTPPVIDMIPTIEPNNPKVGEPVVRITCHATGIPPPTYEFRKGNNLVQEVFVDEQNGIWTITNLQKDDEGVITCVAKNRGGSDEKSYTLYVKTYETNVTASDNETTTNSPVDNATEISDGTFRNDFRCGETAIEVFIPAYLVPNSQLTLRDESCKLVNNGTHHVISFPYNQCGTSEIFYSQQILITNEIKVQSTLKYVDSGPVKFVTDYTIPLNCFPGGNQTVSSVLQILAPEKFQEGVLPNARFEIREYKSANYQEQITAYPVKVPLNREIYFELALTNARPNTSSSIQVSKCQATPSDNPNDRTNYLLVSNGCSASPAVQILARPTPDLFRFSSQAFQFSNANDLIYVHCYVSVCSSGQCTLPCGRPGRGRRSLRGRLQSDLVTLTSSGFQVVTE